MGKKHQLKAAREKEEETEPKQRAMSAIEDMHPGGCFDSKTQFRNNIIPVTVCSRLFFVVNVWGYSERVRER